MRGGGRGTLTCLWGLKKGRQTSAYNQSDPGATSAQLLWEAAVHARASRASAPRDVQGFGQGWGAPVLRVPRLGLRVPDGRNWGALEPEGLLMKKSREGLCFPDGKASVHSFPATEDSWPQKSKTECACGRGESAPWKERYQHSSPQGFLGSS